MNATKTVTNERLIAGYQLCASTEGKSSRSLEAVTSSITYFRRFLATRHENIDLIDATRQEIRGFIAYLQQAQCFSGHRFTPEQDKHLSGHTINCYVRSLRIFYSWLVSEEIIETSSYDGVKIPPPPSKVVSTFSSSQIEHLLKVIDKKTATGYRDYAISTLRYAVMQILANADNPVTPSEIARRMIKERHDINTLI
jgi:site-specific recombinase XerD